MSLNSLAVDHSLWSLLLRFFVNLIVLIILIRVIYYRFSRKEEFLFSFLIMGIMIFLIVALLEMIEIQIGMALGLFAVFAILRFRTQNLSVKDMTYIFTVIGVSVINSQANVPPPVLGAIIINSIIILSVLLLEIYLQKAAFTSHIIIYYKTELLSPDYKKDLLKDLSIQTGQNIEKVRIQIIDIGKGKAELEVFYKGNNPM
jgi:hypothetical protein